MKKGLLIEFDLNTGKRAGNISPRDINLPCHGWQDLESNPAREIRLINDDRDISQYKGIQGVRILNGKTEINQTIIEIVPERYFIQDEIRFSEHLKQRNINLDTYSDKNQQESLQALYKNGIGGIAKSRRRLL